MSKTVQIELPLELIKAANLDTANLSQEAARLLALALFREDQLSLGRAAELCQTPLAAFMEFAAKHGVPPIRYGSTDVENDHSTLEKLRA
jgi:predicted HTH domain antitoxin